MAVKPHELYRTLDHDFIKDGITDLDWAGKMPNVRHALYPSFLKTGMGLMLDFAASIKRVYTTVFLSDNVLSKILSDNITNALIFSHHPTNWSIKNFNGNYSPNESLVQELQKRNISVYVLHHPLDNFGKYSTCKTLADKLKITVQRPAFLYEGALCGVIGTSDFKSLTELSAHYSHTVNHDTSVYAYGDDAISGKKIAVCPGGGNTQMVFDEMVKEKSRC